MKKITSFLEAKNIGKYLIPSGIILVLFSIFMFFVVNNSQGYVEIDAVVSKTELYEEFKESKVSGESEKAEEGSEEETVADIFDVFGNERDKKNTVYVTYMVDGTEYEEVYGVFTGYKEGDRIKISYDPDDPRVLMQPGNLLHPAIILVVGIAAIIAGIICFRKDLTETDPSQQ